MDGIVAITHRKAFWHRFGIGLSALCLAHCLAAPWLLASLPLVTLATLPEALRDSEWLHAVLLAPVLLVSGPVLLRGTPGRWQGRMDVAAFAALIGALFVDGRAGLLSANVTGPLVLLIRCLASPLRIRSATHGRGRWSCPLCPARKQFLPFG